MLRTISCPEFQLISDGFQVSGLLQQLQENPDVYDKYAFRKDDRQGMPSPHVDAPDVWVRFNPADRMDKMSVQEFAGEHISQWYAEAYKISEIFPLAALVMRQVVGEILGGIYIIRVPPKKSVKARIDGSWHSHFYDKYLVCLTNSPTGKFWWENNTMVPKAGELWKFEDDIWHGLVNDSETEDMIIATFNIRTFARAVAENAPKLQMAETPTEQLFVDSKNFGVLEFDPNKDMHLADNLWSMEMEIPAGKMIGKHVHDYTHISMLTKGRGILEKFRPNEELPFQQLELDATNGAVTTVIDADIYHRYKAIEDSQWFCIHSSLNVGE